MWPPEFIEQIRKHLQDNPHIPILDKIWRYNFVKTLEEYRKFLSENSELWQSRIEELERLAQEVAQHNQTINRQYTESVLPIFEDLPEIQAEIQQQFEDGYVLIGYKGLDLDRASQIYEEDLNTHKTVGGPTEASRGHGFYTTTHFDTALDFARLAARMKGSTADKTLLEPTLPPSDDYAANKRYHMEYDRFEEKMRAFEISNKWKKYGIILRIYVNNFFAMHGLILINQCLALPADWKDFDYIEGPMQGGVGETQWEIKFNQHEAIYAKIRALLSPRSDLGHDLPLGSIQMLKAAHERLIAFTADTSYLETQDEKSTTSFHKRT